MQGALTLSIATFWARGRSRLCWIVWRCVRRTSGRRRCGFAAAAATRSVSTGEILVAPGRGTRQVGDRSIRARDALRTRSRSSVSSSRRRAAGIRDFRPWRWRTLHPPRRYDRYGRPGAHSVLRLLFCANPAPFSGRGIAAQRISQSFRRLDNSDVCRRGARNRYAGRFPKLARS